VFIYVAVDNEGNSRPLPAGRANQQPGE